MTVAAKRHVDLEVASAYGFDGHCQLLEKFDATKSIETYPFDCGS